MTALAQIDHALLQFFVGVVAFVDRARLDVAEPQAQVVDQALGPALALRWRCARSVQTMRHLCDADILSGPRLELCDDGQLGFVIDIEIGYEFKGKKSETVATQPVEAPATSESTPATDPASQPAPSDPNVQPAMP